MTSSSLPVLPPAVPPAIDVGDCILAGIGTFKKNPGFHVLAFLVVWIISTAGLGLLSGPMLVGYFRMLAKEAAGEKVEITDLFKGFDDVVPAMVVGVVSSLATMIGMFLLVVPGLFLLPLLPASCYLVATGEKDGIRAVKRGFEAIKVNLLPGMLSMVVLGLLGGLGSIVCFVGLLLTGPIAMLSTHGLAKQMTKGC